METYRQQIARLVEAMTTANCEASVQSDLAGISHSTRVKMFVDGNLDKRLDKLQTQLAFVADAFAEFDDSLVAYIRAVPPVAYDSALSDGQRMLQWLLETKSTELSAVQRDYIACQQARHAVEQQAGQQRARHVRFQELRGSADSLESISYNKDLRIYLNPIRAWGHFTTSALLDDDDAPLPCDVLFFADGEEITSAVFELEGQALLNQLADYEPCTLDEWACLSGLADREELIDLCRDFSEMGLAAVD